MKWLKSLLVLSPLARVEHSIHRLCYSKICHGGGGGTEATRELASQLLMLYIAEDPGAIGAPSNDEMAALGNRFLKGAYRGNKMDACYGASQQSVHGI